MTHRSVQALVPERPGSFVVSLDFELHWGMCDRISVDAYRENLLGVRRAIPRMLELFSEFGIHATWATVGFLFFDRREDLLAALPRRRPSYADPEFSSYNILPDIGASEADDPYHFGRALLELVQRVPHQEIATHTFCHYYCLESGQTVAEFLHDLAAARRAARRIDTDVTSIVFPRNQVASDYVAACAASGLRAYRGSEDCWLYRPACERQQWMLLRALRFVDSYVNLTGHHAAAPETSHGGIVNVPSSRFLRPYKRQLRLFEGLKQRRITRAMSYAAERGLVYHLWWHPHNFGRDLEKNVAKLRAILEHFRSLSLTRGMRSLTMEEVAAEVIGGNTLGEPNDDARRAVTA